MSDCMTDIQKSLIQRVRTPAALTLVKRADHWASALPKIRVTKHFLKQAQKWSNRSNPLFDTWYYASTHDMELRNSCVPGTALTKRQQRPKSKIAICVFFHFWSQEKLKLIRAIKMRFLSSMSSASPSSLSSSWLSLSRSSSLPLLPLLLSLLLLLLSSLLLLMMSLLLEPKSLHRYVLYSMKGKPSDGGRGKVIDSDKYLVKKTTRYDFLMRRKCKLSHLFFTETMLVAP